MHSVSMTAFITHCCRKQGPGADVTPGWLRHVLIVWLLVLGVSAHAAVALDQLTVERQEHELQIQAHLTLDLPAAVEEALRKGVAVHFVAQARLERSRWYWTNQTLAEIHRYYRLAYQPLTRQWRLQVSSQTMPGSGQGIGLAQSFASLPEALGVIGRQSGWTLLEGVTLDASGDYQLAYDFRLDVSQLPRPFQFAVGNQSDWNMQVTRVQPLVVTGGP